MTYSNYLLMPFYVLFILVAFINPCSAELIDRIVAVVNDDIITASELDAEGEPIFKRIREEAPDWQVEKTLEKARQDLLDQLIDKRIIEQRAKQFGIIIADAEVDAAMQNIMLSNNTTLEEFKQTLQKSGHTFDKYREIIRTQILQSRLVGLEVRSKVVITDEKIQEYYNHNYLTQTGKEGYHILQIGVSWDNSSDTSKEKALSKAQMLLKQIQEGESFQDMARNYSDLPSAADGGDIGVFSKDELAADMHEMLNNMKPGEISPIIETPAAYQFFKLVSIRENGIIQQAPFENVKEEIRRNLYEQELRNQFDKWVKELREEAYIKKNL